MTTTHKVEEATSGSLLRRRSKLGPWVAAALLLAGFAPPARARLVPAGAEFRVSTGSAALPTAPAVAMDPSGRSIVVWGKGGDIAGRRFDGSGRALDGELVVNTDTSAFHVKPAVAVDALGGFVVVWESFEPEPSDYAIRGQRFDASGAPVGGEFRVDTATTDRQHHPVVAADPTGGFLLVWEGHDLRGASLDSSGIFAQRYDESGEPIGEELRISGSARFAGAPALATDSAGNLVVVWEGAGDGAGIFGRRYDAAGLAVGGVFQISDATPDAQLAPAVATDATGGLVVVWQRAAAYASQVVGRRHDRSGLPIGDVFAVTASTGYVNAAPRVATFPSGGFLVVWEKDDLSRLFFAPGDVAARQYRPNGDPEGCEIRVNRARDGDQRLPALAVDPTGNVVVLWHSVPDDGSETGIFGRRYTASSVAERARRIGRSMRRASSSTAVAP
jgi:hypothetical protein